jgi:hypothetical protein
MLLGRIDNSSSQPNCPAVAPGTALPGFAEEACAVIALNWRSNSRDLASAQDWAFSIVRQSVESTVR